MQYDTDWLVANLQDMVQLCRANTMTQTARRIEEAINCAMVERDMIATRRRFLEGSSNENFKRSGGS